jgi:hypothetical protein
MIVNYHSKTGITLPFEPYDYYGPWIPNIGGLYVFAIYMPYQNVWTPLYIGKAKCFKDRFSNHHKWYAAFNKGVRQVLAVKVDDAKLRTLLEAEMIRECNPELNEAIPLSGLSNYADLTYPGLGFLGAVEHQNQRTLGGLGMCKYRGQ